MLPTGGLFGTHGRQSRLESLYMALPLILRRRPILRKTLVALTVVLFAGLLKMPALVHGYQDRQRLLQELDRIRAEDDGFDRPPFYRHQFDSAELERQIRERIGAIGPESVVFVLLDPNPDSARPKNDALGSPRNDLFRPAHGLLPLHWAAFAMSLADQQRPV